MGSTTRLHDPRYQNFTRVIRRWRQEAHLTQTELGNRMGKGASFISKCELGERRVDGLELVEWIKATGIPIERAMRELGSI